LVEPSDSAVYLGWRLLESDPPTVAFNVYRSTGGGPAVRLNAKPIRRTTDYLDAQAAACAPAGRSLAARSGRDVAFAIGDEELGVGLAAAADAAVGTQITVRPRDLGVAASVRNDLTSRAGRLTRPFRRWVPPFPDDFAQASRRIFKQLIESPP